MEIDDGTGGDFTPAVGLENNYLLLDFTVTGHNITKSILYRLRYRALNAIGWGSYSPIAYVRAANQPAAPLRPSYNTSTTDTVTLNIPRSMDDGGSPILGYKLWRDQGNDFSSAFVEVPSYTDNSELFTTSAALDGLETGKIYRFKTTAFNKPQETGAEQSSNFSLEVIIGCGANVPQPNEVTRDENFRSASSILVHWDPVASSDLPVTGYTLEMDDGLGGDFTEIYDGRENLQIFEYEVAGLVSQRLYRFRVAGIDVNGVGQFSTPVALRACKPPETLAQPEILSISKTEFEMGWEDPLIFGGCPVTSFQLYRDDGELGEVSIPIDPDEVALRTDRYKFTVVLDETFTGKSMRVKVEASNVMGSVTSRATQFTLSDVPGKPTPAPQVDKYETTTN